MKSTPSLRFPGFDENWQQVALGEATKVIDCKHRTPQYIETGVPIISPGTIKWGALDTTTPTKRVTEEDYLSLMDHCDPQLDDLVLSRNQSMGVASRITTREKFVLGQDTVLIQQRDGNGGIVFFRLQTGVTQVVIGKLSGGSTFSRINVKDIRELPIVIPATSGEQRKIADFLTAVDGRIGQLSQKKALLEDYKKGVMQQLFTQALRFKDDHGNDFPEWEEKKLGQIGRIIRGSSPRPQGDSRYYGGPVPRLMVQDVTRDGKWVTPCIDSLTEAGARLSRPCPAGTLTIVCSGTVGVVSFLAVDACIHDGFLALVDIDESTVTKDFLFHRLNTLRDQFERGATHGGVFTNLTTSEIKEFSFQCPSLPEQTKIANFLTALDRKIESVSQQITHTQAFKKGLLQQMFV